MKRASNSKEWKKLIEDIREANKDPEFRKAVQRFIDIASNHS